MKNKGFTLLELLIVVVALSIITAIGVPVFASIVERMQVRSDRLSANEIGKAICLREEMVKKEDKVQYYPVVTRYDTLAGIGNYINTDHKPQSMKDGYYFVTALQVDKVKKILVGIGKEEMPVTNEVYMNPRASGWAYIQGGDIGEFLLNNSEILNETIEMPENYEKEEENIEEGNALPSSLKVGDRVKYSSPAGTFSITSGGITSTFSSTNNWQVFSINNGTVALISEESVGTLTLAGKDGYRDVVSILNNISSKYVDNKIAVSGRGLGSSGSSIGSINEADNKITWEDAVNDLPYKDSTYTADRDIIASHEELQVSGDTWLASRHMIPSEDYTYFAVRYLPANNSEATKSLYMARKTKIDDSLGEIPLGVRPIIYLDSDVVISGNNGNYTVSKK